MARAAVNDDDGTVRVLEASVADRAEHPSEPAEAPRADDQEIGVSGGFDKGFGRGDSLSGEGDDLDIAAAASEGLVDELLDPFGCLFSTDRLPVRVGNADGRLEIRNRPPRMDGNNLGLAEPSLINGPAKSGSRLSRAVDAHDDRTSHESRLSPAVGCRTASSPSRSHGSYPSDGQWADLDECHSSDSEHGKHESEHNDGKDDVHCGLLSQRLSRRTACSIGVVSDLIAD